MKEINQFEQIFLKHTAPYEEKILHVINVLSDTREPENVNHLESCLHGLLEQLIGRSNEVLQILMNKMLDKAFEYSTVI